jgi:hypothetical protein
MHEGKLTPSDLAERHAVVWLVEALLYKPEVSGFDSQ